MAVLDNPIIQDIANYTADNTSLVMRDTIYAGELKRGVNGVFAVAAPSEAPDKETGILYQSVDFWARNEDTGKAFEHLTEIFNLFDRKHHYTARGYFVHFSHNDSNIEDMDKDAEGAKLLKLSVRLILNSTTAIS